MRLMILLALLLVSGSLSAQTQGAIKRVCHVSRFELAVACIKKYEGLHGPKHHPYVGYGHKLLPGERFFGKILPNGVEIFAKTEGSTFYFQSPLPYLCTCTITVDAKRKDHVEERKSERQMKIETSRKFLDCAIKNGTASCGYKSCIQY